MNNTNTATVVGHIDDLPVGGMRLVKVDGRRLCLIRLSTGVQALDNACPHEGYGLTQGYVRDGVLTCAWHNWKFDIATGTCIVGEENARTHTVVVGDDGAISIELVNPSDEDVRPKLLASLRRGIASEYAGQIARDTIRLLKAHADPAELVWEAIAHGAPRNEFGWGHAVASAADCLTMLSDHEGDSRAFPIVQAITGLAEEARAWPPRPLPDPSSAADSVEAAFLAHVEAEECDRAQSTVRGALASGAERADLARWFGRAVSAHHLSYGHGAIYVQKAFELLDVLGWDRADTVLPHLVPAIVYGTREDTLPYMRPFMKWSRTQDLRVLTTGASRSTPIEPIAAAQLRASLLDTSDRTAALVDCFELLQSGVGLHELLDVIVDAVSERMLRYDVAGERDLSDDFGWLDITHGLTYANAARWHVDQLGIRPETVQLVLFTLFLAHWTGRHEWHTGIGPRVDTTAFGGLDDAAIDDVARALRRDSLLDRTSSFIVHAHGVKTSVAASREAKRSGSALPLAAARRFLDAPKMERFVAATVQQSLDFLSGRARRDDEPVISATYRPISTAGA